MKQFTTDDIEALALGSAVLGSGGGGDPCNDLLMAQYAIEKFGPVSLISVEELTPDAIVVPLAFMGAPLVCSEKLINGREIFDVIAAIEKSFGRPIDALMPAEIGGANAFAPLLVAGELNLPIIDADCIGRAFPQLQMNSCNLAGVNPWPAFLADGLGNTVTIETKNAHDMERLARQVTIAMGSNAALAFHMMQGRDQVQSSVVPGSITTAIAIGKAILQARQEQSDPVEKLIKATNGKLLSQGTITDIDQCVQDGFLEGTLSIHTPSGDVQLIYQNEYLLAKKGTEILGTTPDILMLLETESGTPITSESLRFGLRVSLIAIEAPKIWQSEKALKLVGPRVFGFDADYKGF